MWNALPDEQVGIIADHGPIAHREARPIGACLERRGGLGNIHDQQTARLAGTAVIDGIGVAVGHGDHLADAAHRVRRAIRTDLGRGRGIGQVRLSGHVHHA